MRRRGGIYKCLRLCASRPAAGRACDWGKAAGTGIILCCVCVFGMGGGGRGALKNRRINPEQAEGLRLESGKPGATWLDSVIFPDDLLPG